MTPVERFWARVDQTEGCWLWIGQTSDGYGQFHAEGNKVLAHRFAYELLVGPIPQGLEIDHLCRIRHCVNPAHMEAVTHSENLRRGRSPHRELTHCPAGHPYDEVNTLAVTCPDGTSHRRCRVCHAQREKARRARIKAEALAVYERLKAGTP